MVNVLIKNGLETSDQLTTLYKNNSGLIAKTKIKYIN